MSTSSELSLEKSFYTWISFSGGEFVEEHFSPPLAQLVFLESELNS